MKQVRLFFEIFIVTIIIISLSFALAVIGKYSEYQKSAARVSK